MNQLQIHAPPPVGYGVYWAIAQNWRSPVLLGLLFVTVVFVALFPWVRWETANQETSYAAALAALDTDRYQAPASRRDAELRSGGGIYTWRMIVREKSAAVDGPELLFTIVVDRPNGYRIRSATLEAMPARVANTPDL